MIGRALRVIAGYEDNTGTRENETSLILEAQGGNAAAFKELYDRYKDRVFNLIYYTLRGAHSSEDVLQTVFVKVYQALPYFRQESCFHTWVYRVALNECKNQLRRKKLFVPFHDANGEFDAPDPSRRPDQDHLSRQVSMDVRKAVSELSPKLREVVVLKYLEELSYEEVASILRCSPGTVASRLHRALSTLEKKLRSGETKQNEAGG